MTRSIPTTALAIAMTAAALAGTFGPSVAHAGDEACTTTKFKFKQVEAACKKGGRKAVKGVMKAAVKKAKAAGEKINCKSCHEDLKSYKLKPNAADDLKKWI